MSDTTGDPAVQARREQRMTDLQAIALLTAAEQIADGLAELALVIYDRDPRWKDQLAAANATSVQMQEARREAEKLTDAEYDESDGHA